MKIDDLSQFKKIGLPKTLKADIQAVIDPKAKQALRAIARYLFGKDADV